MSGALIVPPFRVPTLARARIPSVCAIQWSALFTTIGVCKHGARRQLFRSTRGLPISGKPLLLSVYCFGVEPFVERLLSFFLLSDEPGRSFDVPMLPSEVPALPAPVVPMEVPLAAELVRTDGGIGWLCRRGCILLWSATTTLSKSRRTSEQECNGCCH
jgi:hypothetical protein